MLESTGNKQLDGAALEAYTEWRFQPGTGSQVNIQLSLRVGQNFRRLNAQRRSRQSFTRY
jgi:TonB family protein